MIIHTESFDNMSLKNRHIVEHTPEVNLRKIMEGLPDVTMWFLNINKGTLMAFAGVQKRGVHTLILGPCFVFEEFRGKGIQRKLIKAREKFAIQEGYMELLANTERKNIISANNFIRSGFLLCEPWNKGLKRSHSLCFRKQL